MQMWKNLSQLLMTKNSLNLYYYFFFLGFFCCFCFCFLGGTSPTSSDRFRFVSGPPIFEKPSSFGIRLEKMLWKLGLDRFIFLNNLSWIATHILKDDFCEMYYVSSTLCTCAHDLVTNRYSTVNRVQENAHFYAWNLSYVKHNVIHIIIYRPMKQIWKKMLIVTFYRFITLTHLNKIIA